jgi:TonB family protein
VACTPPLWRRIAFSGTVSFVIHLFVVPFGIARLLVAPDPQLEIAFIDDEEERDGEASSATPAPEKLALLREKKPEEKKEEEPEEPARRPEPKEEQKPEERPLLVIPNAHLKMVDQDQFPDEADNPDANYLAQKNHRAEKETRAEDTNLLMNQQGERVSAESQNAKEQVGEAERKIAELEDRPGPKDRLPLTGAKEEQPAQGALAMRDPAREAQRDGVEPVPEAGPLPLMQEGQGGGAPRQGGPRLSLSYDDYERVVGPDVAERERREALSQRSRSLGRWERVQQKVAMMRASLENFTPAVRPGNQSELGTRKHPFAAFIAAMHRQIHKFWGFGYLVELDGKSPGSPLNDFNLWTGLEITLKGDGTVDRIIIEHPSGNGVFDAAAMDAVMSAAPFPSPPEVIKSRDGKIYISWRFHRDARQCATDFVDPHILTTPPKPGEAPPARTPEPPRLADGPPKRPLQLFGLGGGGPQKGAPAPDRPAAAEPPPERRGGAQQRSSVPDEARQAAQKWLLAYTRGDVRWLAGYSAVPFSAGGKTVAEDGEELRTMYRQLVAEREERTGTLAFYTAAQIKQKIGRLPAGGDEEDMVFAMLRSGSDDMVLLLQPADKGWRVVGIDR